MTMRLMKASDTDCRSFETITEVSPALLGEVSVEVQLPESNQFNLSCRPVARMIELAKVSQRSSRHVPIYVQRITPPESSEAA